MIKLKYNDWNYISIKKFDEIFKKPTKEQILDLMNGKSPEEVFKTAEVKETNEEDEKVGF